MLSYVTCSPQVLRELVYELLNCVFEDYSAAPRSFSLEQSVEDFSAMRLFVEGYADQCEQIEDVSRVLWPTAFL
jgi:hypothetical protein